ncbi:MAG: ATP-binding protein [Bryobacterales bacterium]|nr:ATP-binding protein [Bryobacterales bacterium]
MSDKTRALLVEDNEGDHRLLKAALAEVSDPQIELGHVSRMADAVNWLAREKFDVILLDLSLPDSQGLNTLAQGRQAAPGVPIVVMTGLDDEGMAIRALESGAQDYLVKGKFDGNQLVRAIRHACARSEGLAAKSGAAPHKVIGFLGAKGGCGVTTLACHVAAELGRLTGSPTLLADFDLVAGAAGFLMKSTSPHSVLDAVDMLDGLDLSSWRSIISSVAPNLDILAAPATLAGRMLPRPERLAQVLKFARLNYPWTVVDLGRGLSDYSLSLLDHLDSAFLVTTPDVLALARSRQIVEALAESSYPPERIHLVVNRTTGRAQLTLKDIERLLKLPVEAALPDASDDLATSYAHGKLAPAGSALGEKFAGFAARLAGIQPLEAKSRWFSLFGRQGTRGPDGDATRPEGGATVAGEQLRALLEGTSAGRKSGQDGALRQLNQELAGARAELQQFAYMASHDFREPVRLIAGYVQLLAQRTKGRLDAEADDLMASALEGVDQMQERIDGLLEYARVTTTGAGFQPTACEDALAEAISGLRKSIDESAAVISHQSLPVVLADASQIRIVFHNLIANALKFRSADAPRVVVRVEQSGNEWVFAVQDNGIGLDPQYAARIFQLFQRLHTRTERPGAGVGLAVVKRIVERHGGRVWVESEPGKGLTFYFTISEAALAAGSGHRVVAEAAP